MPKPLKDYTGRCGSCSHFSFYVIDGVLRYRGNCDCANTGYYMHNNRRGCRYKAQHSSYRQASQKACKKYLSMNVATVHVYRKTFASREYQRTKDILYVSHRLGHANTAVTEKYYICDDILADRKMANVA